MRLCSLALLALILIVPQKAQATGEYTLRETLVGWSEDGEVWIVRVAEGDGESEPAVATYSVYKKGVEVERGDKLVVLEAKYPVVRLKKEWRTRFQQRFVGRNRGARPDYEPPCYSQWQVFDKTSNKEISKLVVSEGCTRFLGGYIHASGGFALIKFRQTEIGRMNLKGESKVWARCCYAMDTYTLVRLK
jgi:hypothetical protein